MTSFWLSNTCRLLHCLKQYSGDEVSADVKCPKSFSSQVLFLWAQQHVFHFRAPQISGQNRDQGVSHGGCPCFVQMWSPLGRGHKEGLWSTLWASGLGMPYYADSEKQE